MKKIYFMMQDACYLFSLQLKRLLFILSTPFLFPVFLHAQDILTGVTSNGGAEGRGTVFSVKTTGANFTTIKSFADWGKTPWGDLKQGTDGNFYGMTSLGGTYTYGTIFQVTPTGVVTVRRHLNYATDGANPIGELTIGADGNFYGMTSSGGANSYGTIFKMTPGGTYTVLRHLTHADGTNPRGHMVIGADGNFYGATYAGGANSYGSIFKMTPTGTFSVLRSLSSAADGANCYGSLVKGNDNNFYGITNGGGTFGQGTIFRITSTGVYTVLRHMNLNDGEHSQSDLIQATDGNFYGMAYAGGSNNHGTIFKISATGTFTVLKSLLAADGYAPYGGLLQGPDGNFYGETSGGGSSGGGTIFKITPAGTLTVLRSLVPATDGGDGKGGLVRGTDGNYYGMTNSGGSNTFGTVFKITPAGIYTVLAKLNGSSLGNAPYESLLKAKDSSFYGTTSSGGLYNYGTIFRICNGVVTVLHSMNRTTDGGTPNGSLIQATDGFLYGTASIGGASGAGTIFKISTTGTFTLLRSLSYSADGSDPQGSLVQGADGALYGMNKLSGTNGAGTIFKITTAGVFSVLRHLLSATDGTNPEGNLIKGTDGNFYGMTFSNARIFKITPAGIFTVLHTLVTAEGSYPSGSLVLHSNGNFYGTASGGGTNNAGTIFKVTPAGIVTVLKLFNPAIDGSVPKGNLVIGNDGNLYGLTSIGGTYNVGTFFKITPTGGYSVLRHFNMATDGGNPFGSLIIAPVNNLVASPQSITTAKNTAKPVTLAGSGSTTLIYTIISPPQHGVVTAGSAASRTYTPALNYSGSDVFTFSVSVGCLSSAPAAVNITISPTLTAFAINESSSVLSTLTSRVKIYPNPVTNKVTVTLGVIDSRFAVNITDIDGNTLMQTPLMAKGTSVFEMNISKLKPGIYFLHVQTTTGRQNLKFVKL
jgi:uncharacterized repeat protein (TIGR03803 family)